MYDDIILFRGKRVDNGEWVEGHFFTQVYHSATLEEDWYWFIKPIGGEPWEYYRIDPKTLGQFTKKRDRKGVRVFEDDIVKVYLRYLAEGDPYGVAVVVDANTLSIKGLGRWMPQDTVLLEVIGNTQDNPELLGGADHE